MNKINGLLSQAQQAKLSGYDRWYQNFEDSDLRKECPDAYHDELLRQADELDRLGIISLQEWRDLRVQADQAYLRAIAGEDYKVEAEVMVDHAFEWHR